MLLLLTSPQVLDAEDATPPQHRPFITWVKALKTSDLDMFKSVYSRSRRESFEKRGWEAVMKEYQEGFTERFGDYDVKDFTIAFEGNEKSGRLVISFKGEDVPRLDIVLEGDEWRIDEN